MFRVFVKYLQQQSALQILHVGQEEILGASSYKQVTFESLYIFFTNAINSVSIFSRIIFFNNSTVSL